ncbi:hypothetical protein JW826_00695 [Candidatus Woesearchaeota archaeon]|nr:hypothetical protein [Candidatus Woesearchaeota archaeon]
MGLFAKKKDSSQAEPSNSKVPDFNTLLQAPPGPPPSLDIPPPGQAGILGMLPPPQPGVPPMDQQPLPGTVQKNLPAFDVPTPPAQAPPSQQVPIPPPQSTGEDAEFELPDFDEDEIKSLEARPAPKEAPVPAKWTIDPGTKYSEQADEVQTNFIPEPRRTRPESSYPKEKYLDIRNFFRAKEELSKARIMTRRTEESTMEETYKGRLERYNMLSAELNAIQDKLMIIDNKLFEN